MDEKPEILRIEKVKEIRERNEERAKINKITTGNVITKKQTLLKRFSNFFLGSDTRSVKEYVLNDIFVPAIKNTIVEAIYAVSDSIGGGFEMLFFGDRSAKRRANVHRDGQRSYVSYESQYNSLRSGSTRGFQAGRMLAAARARHNFDDIILDNRGEAEEVLSYLVDLIVDYGSARVADLYALTGVNAEYPDNTYGWTDLRGASVVRVPNGYLLDLPRPIALD
jgi:hypothetical protein